MNARHISMLLLAFGGIGQVFGQPVPVLRGADYGDPVTPRVINIDLRNLPVRPAWRPGDPIKEIPRRHTRPALAVPEPEPRIDPLLAVQAAAKQRRAVRAFTTPILNFDGQGYTGVTPPDTVGDVGIDYYIQAVNAYETSYIIYNKSDGSVAAGPFTLSDLGGTGGCATGGGDPIVLFDSMANRWVLSEFASAGSTLCVYISQTSDPISGGWYNYSFTTPSFPDYPKYAVWPDAFYVTSNEDSSTAYALERARMLLGLSATFQRFTVGSLAGFSFQSMTPADLDGPAPPSGSPAYIMRHNDDEAHNPGGANGSEDYLELYAFHVDWNTPANSTLTGPVSIPVTEFDSSLCGLTSFSCIDQPGAGSSNTLDPLREVIMWRLQYRNFGTHEALIGCFATDVDGTDHAGVRWFELRKVGAGAWTLYQEGTYAPDSDNRWMASIAMDGSGNIALGYNISSSSTYPGLRYAGRLAGDPLGTLPQSETALINGTAANSGNRYGDYAAMTVDPVDDCGFWFTGEYNSSGQWSTRVASFVFDECGCTPADAPSGVSATPNGDNRVDVSWATVAGADTYNIYRALGPCPQPSFIPIVTDVSGTGYSDTNVSGDATYAYVVRSFVSSNSCESTNSACVSAEAAGVCTLPPTFAGVKAVANLAQSICGLRVTWNAATSPCGAPLVYNVYRSTASDFMPGPANLIASCLGDLFFDDVTVATGVAYYYVVRAEHVLGLGWGGPCGDGVEDANLVRLPGVASGPAADLLTDDFESGSGQWTTAALPEDTGLDPWAIMIEASAPSPTHVYFCQDEDYIKDQVVQMASSVAISPGVSGILTFSHLVETETGYDGGVLEYSTDGGTTWFDILEGDGGSVPANSDRITSGGYNAVISSSYQSPISGRDAWAGSFGAWSDVEVDLSDFAGTSIRFRWRLACDNSVPAEGWYVDDVKVTAYEACTPGGYEAWRSRYTWTNGTGEPNEDGNSNGVSNFESYFHGLDPTGTASAASLSNLPNLALGPSGVVFRFTRSTDDVMAATYVIKGASNVLDQVWVPVVPVPNPDASGHVVTPVDMSASYYFFRLDVSE